MALIAIADRPIVAGIGAIVVSDDPVAVLIAYGLGSCVALSGWDPGTRIGGLAHFMLPSGSAPDPRAPAKFIEGGLEGFLAEFRRAGASVARARFTVAGGAATLTASASLGIGRRNVEALLAGLDRARIRVAAADTGGTGGRTVQLHVATGRLLVKSVSGSREL